MAVNLRLWCCRRPSVGLVSNQLKRANWQLSTSGNSKYRAVMKNGSSDLKGPVHHQIFTSVGQLSYRHAQFVTIIYYSASQTCPGGPLSCIFCMSPWSNTPDSTHQLVSRDCKNYIRCVWLGRHTKCAGQGILQDRFGKHCSTKYNVYWIKYLLVICYLFHQ